jgi:hypothetical protein
MKKILLACLLLASCFSAFGFIPDHKLKNESRLSSPSVREDIFGCSLNAEILSTGGIGTLLPGGTGNRSLDSSIQTDVQELQRVFRVSAKMFLLQEANNPNAFALSKPLPEVLASFRILPQSTPDGMVILGLNLMQSEYKSQFGTGHSIPSIIAHEYAHILQYKVGFPFTGKWRELHADYLAGWYTAHRSRFVPQNMVESMLAFFKRGDYEYNNLNHHGTPLERQRAFSAGMNLNLKNNVRSGRVAYEQGIQYLRHAPY